MTDKKNIIDESDYQKIVKKINNEDLPLLFLNIFESQMSFLEKKELTYNEQTYKLLFVRHMNIFKTIMSLIDVDGNMDIASINILTRSALEIAVTLCYLIHPITNSDITDEREFKINIYHLQGYLSKQEEFRQKNEININTNNIYLPDIENKIAFFDEKIKSSSIYTNILNSVAKKKYKEKRFLYKDGFFTFYDFLALYKFKFLANDLRYLNGFTHSGYESFCFQKKSEYMKNEQAFILYISSTLVFDALMSYFDFDLKSLNKQELCIIIEFLSIIHTDKFNKKDFTMEKRI